MSTRTPVTTEPFHLSGRAGRLFGVCVSPPPSRINGASILYIPPFGEEQNRSRVTISRTARSLAAIGYTVAQVDPFGTGDSEGDFAEADWELWQDDMLRAARWVTGRTGSPRLVLWGLRLGVPLAASLLTPLAGEVRTCRLLAWHPVISGRQFLTQFLRLRVATGLMDAGAGGETVAGLREQLEGGTTIEVGGYALSGRLAAALDAIDLAATPTEALPPVDWLEIVPRPDRPPSPVSRRLHEAWLQQGVGLHCTVAAGEQFWNTPEIVIPRRLIELTLARAAAWSS